VVRLLDAALAVFDEHVGPVEAHGSERLHFRGVVGTLLAAAFEPATRSLRTIDDLSEYPSVQKVSGVDRVARSTLSDALAKFEPGRLRPMIAALRERLPHLDRLDPETAQVARRVIAMDGSWFNLAGEVAHALHCNRGNTSQKQARVRWDLQLDVDEFLPVDFDVGGKGDGSEAAAFMRRLRGDCIYVVDRNFVHFGFLNAVLAAKSNVVLRLKKGVNFAADRTHDLTEKDRANHVLKDETGRLTGPTSAGNADARSCTDQPPQRTLRRVTVWDEKNRCEVVLLTDLLDVPAYVIGTLYRQRWQIELFFRWLKVLAGFRHLISQSPRGITTQFYVAVLMALLIQLHNGRRRLSKYALIWVGWIAQDRATPEMMARAMARHERERLLERLRLNKKKQKA